MQQHGTEIQNYMEISRTTTLALMIKDESFLMSLFKCYEIQSEMIAQLKPKSTPMLSFVNPKNY
jgi:hypothetical protein